MIDLHTHSLFSDGLLLPSELVYRAKVNGYEAIALTDHGDLSTIDFVIPRIIKISKELTEHFSIKVLPGIELTYVPPSRISAMVKKCRSLGAKIVVIHGQSPVEPVPPGTNRAAISSGADILAHPGHITEEEVKLAKKTGICLEITTRNGHNKTNSHVAGLSKKFGAKMVLNTDTHAPEDILTPEKIEETLKTSNLTKQDYEIMIKNSKEVVKKTK
ncbi:MAG: histidinol phosphate phosphatase domain-containing protein [Endomicrobiales bacterium]|nr:histidinol phosphate phosphatase domain-containing protein [Endomicrobiales bacterium]